MGETNGGPRSFRDPADLRRILAALLNLLGAAVDGLDYRLLGTAAALAQGVPVVAGDIDLLMRTRTAVDRFADALAGHPGVSPPRWIGVSSQYYAGYLIDGFKVEASTVEQPSTTDTHECIGPGPWTHHVDVPVDGHLVPAVRLELRLATELVRARADRYEPLLSHLRTRGADLSLIERAMADREVPAHLRRLVTSRLGALPSPAALD